MTKCQTAIFLARDHQDAVDLVERLREARIDAEVVEVIVGQDRRGWQVLVPVADASRVRSIATLLEVQRYGQWQGRRPDEAHWGVLEGEDDLRDPIPIYTAQSVMQAHFLKNLLADQGITAVVTNQLLHGGAGIDLVGTPTAAKVLVAAEDAEAAREFALEFDERGQEPVSWPGGEPDDRVDRPWPTCPQCHAKRTTRCPICETSGTDFAEADRGFLGELADIPEGAPAGSSCGCSGSCSSTTPADSEKDGSTAAHPQDDADDSEAMLMCSVCDEPFKPTYPKQCEWCSHQFEDGYVIDQIVDPEEISGRAIAIVVALGLVLLGGIAYFMVILGGS